MDGIRIVPVISIRPHLVVFNPYIRDKHRDIMVDEKLNWCVIKNGVEYVYVTPKDDD